MIPNGELAATVRRGLARARTTAVLALMIGAGSAQAGDRALAEFLGYSSDGRYFAFEEYGIQDGSGFAYSTIYVIDLPADAWVAGTPYRVQAGDSDADALLSDIRGEAGEQAAAKLETLGIETPAEVLVLLGDGVPGADGKSMAFSLPVWWPPGSTGEAVFSLELTTFDAESAEPCQDYIGEKARGFALSFASGGDLVGLYRDGKLPKSRGCPLDYRLYAVVRPFAGGAGPAVVIISSYPFGFEGPNRRFLVLPLGD